MRIAVVGASGRTGAQVVREALRRGHEVIAIARRPEAVAIPEGPMAPRAECVAVTGDVLDANGLTRALSGAEAVVSTLGVGTSRQPTVVYSQGTTNIVRAMQEHGIRPLTVISAAPVGPREEQPFVPRRLIMPVLDRLFGATYDDMRRMEAVLQRSDRDWVALRPPRLVDRPAAGGYRLGADRPPPRANSITYADLAAALLDCLDRPDLYHRAVSVAG